MYFEKTKHFVSHFSNVQGSKQQKAMKQTMKCKPKSIPQLYYFLILKYRCKCRCHLVTPRQQVLIFKLINVM